MSALNIFHMYKIIFAAASTPSLTSTSSQGISESIPVMNMIHSTLIQDIRWISELRDSFSQSWKFYSVVCEKKLFFLHYFSYMIKLSNWGKQAAEWIGERVWTERIILLNRVKTQMIKFCQALRKDFMNSTLTQYCELMGQKNRHFLEELLRK